MWNVSEIAIPVNIIIFHTQLSSLQLQAMTWLRFPKIICLQGLSPLKWIFFATYLVSGHLQLCPSFLQVHVLTKLSYTLSVFWYWSRSNQMKMLFCGFVFYLLLLPLCPHLIKKQHFPLFSSFFAISLMTVFLSLLCTQFTHCFSFCFGFLVFVSLRFQQCIIFFFLLAKKLTL